MVIFSEDGCWKHPLNLSENEKPLVLVTNNESTFNSNDRKRQIWMENRKQLLRPKGRRKGITASEFLTPGGRLNVPDSISDEELLQQIDWPLDGNGKPARYATELFEFEKDNHWTGDKMVDQAVKIATRGFFYAYPGCQALFAFDNSSHQSCYAEDALLVRNMNLGQGEKQPILRNGFNHITQEVQSMVFSDDPPNPSLRGKPKGIKQVLIEIGL